MPAREDIKSILIIGSGPIVIGQACEFDYSGNQAVKALKEEQYRVIVHNPNPASVMTIADRADAVYMDPLDIEHLCAIVEKERPDAILPTMGGQTALNLAMEFHASDRRKKYGVEFIGAHIESINLAEDRGLFKEKMMEIGYESPFSKLIHTEYEAQDLAEEIGYPIIIRPSFTLGGHGGGIAYDSHELKVKIRRALAISPNHTALIEESLLGYQEFEFEVMRDAKDNALVVCAIENIDPMGIHTGDSITIAPIQTLSDREYQLLRTISINILRAVGVECGGSNVQLAYNPDLKRLLVIEMNPRVSRSSALASKVTGFPIARYAAKLAVGYTLDEITNEITGTTKAFFEPALDYVAIKVPRFDIHKCAITELGTQMHSVGEALALGRTFPETLNKAFRAIEQYGEGLEALDLKKEVLDTMICTLHPQRMQAAYTLLLRYGMEYMEHIRKHTQYHPWFLHYIARIASMERSLLSLGEQGSQEIESDTLREAKSLGFTDIRIHRCTGIALETIEKVKNTHNIAVQYHRVDTCAGEFSAKTPYFYSAQDEIDEDGPLEKKKVAILGSGPNRIGQGLEFDTCCTMAALSLREKGYRVIMINCNPETVSTDYDISDRLYIAPLHVEDVYEILKKENIAHAIFQLGGQTPINLIEGLRKKGIQSFGGSFVSIHEAENRELFSNFIDRVGLCHTPSKTAHTLDEVPHIARDIGYPLLIRPSYVIGGQSMVIVYSEQELAQYVDTHTSMLQGKDILVDKFLENAVEYDIDAVTDGTSVLIGGVLQHIEHAGIHSGDSACVFTDAIGENDIITALYKATYIIATRLGKSSDAIPADDHEGQDKGQGKGQGTRGFLNIQFAVVNNIVYVLEVNPRASRTVPFISKTSGVNLVDIATSVWLGEALSEMSVFKTFQVPHSLVETSHIAVCACKTPFAVKEAVFSFNRFNNIDPVLTPEMRSTGESIGMGDTFGEAFAKASASAGVELPVHGTVFISVALEYRAEILSLVDALLGMGFSLVGTEGTAQYFGENGRPCRAIKRITDGSPHVIDEIQSGNIDFMVNIIKSNNSVSFKDDKAIRIAAVKYHIPYVTTLQALIATIEGMEYIKKGNVIVRSLT